VDYNGPTLATRIPPDSVGAKQFRRLVHIAEIQWRATYAKFRGRGRNAAEKFTGADGILQIEFIDKSAGLFRTKGILFQAKKRGSEEPSRLIAQVQKMEQLAPHGSAVFEYSESGYHAIDGTDVIESNGRIAKSTLQSLDHYLADRFLRCAVGMFGLYYDHSSKVLTVPGGESGVAGLLGPTRHELRIRVRSSEIAGIVSPRPTG